MQLETKNEYIMYHVHSLHLNNGHINKKIALHQCNRMLQPPTARCRIAGCTLSLALPTNVSNPLR